MAEPSPRLASSDFSRLVPGAYPAIDALSASADGNGLDRTLLEFVNLRASQLNGCAYCVQYHTSNLRDLGVAADKLALVAVWREAGIFPAREAAALAWTEAVTLLADTRVPNDVFVAARQVFTDKELAALTAAIGAINVWNRISVAFRFTPAVAG